MQFVSENSTAVNGARVQSGVVLDVEGIGVVAKPFRVDVSVNSVTLYTSHHATKAEADEQRNRMHAAYLEVHTGVLLT